MHGRRPHPTLLALLGIYWLIGAIYLLWPFDLLPDTIPLLGLADDLLGVLVGLGLAALVRLRSSPSGGDRGPTPR